MRKSLLVIGIFSWILCSGCNYGPGVAVDSASATGGPPSPALLQYAEDLTRSWSARYSAKSWKTEIDDIRPAGPVHIVTEGVCPDRYRVVVTGSENSETIYVGKTMYSRTGKSRWVQNPMPTSYQGLQSCGTTRANDVDPARIRLIADQLKEVELSKPTIREFGARQCREWTRSFQTGKRPYMSSSCYDIKTHDLVHAVTGTTVTTYSWNIPIDIHPPI